MLGLKRMAVSSNRPTASASESSRNFVDVSMYTRSAALGSCSLVPNAS